MAVCPVCKVNSVKKRATWRGLLYCILCFPCGIYCCLKNRVWFCPLCTNEINYSDGREPSFSRDYRCYRSFKKVSNSDTTDNEEHGIPESQTTSCGRTVSGDSESTSSTIPVLKQ
uniref:Brain protein I3 n=1 Tax=Onchocerca volvulus TaxID=6282 RepID=A0A8R1XNC2_ONCVO